MKQNRRLISLLLSIVLLFLLTACEQSITTPSLSDSESVESEPSESESSTMQNEESVFLGDSVCISEEIKAKLNVSEIQNVVRFYSPGFSIYDDFANGAKVEDVVASVPGMYVYYAWKNNPTEDAYPTVRFFEERGYLANGGWLHAPANEFLKYAFSYEALFREAPATKNIDQLKVKTVYCLFEMHSLWPYIYIFYETDVGTFVYCNEVFTRRDEEAPLLFDSYLFPLEDFYKVALVVKETVDGIPENTYGFPSIDTINFDVAPYRIPQDVSEADLLDLH